MATLGSVTVDCPVCGEVIVFGVEVSKIIYTKLDREAKTVEMRGQINVVVPDPEDPMSIPAGHDQCFGVSDEDRASLLAVELELGRD